MGKLFCTANNLKTKKVIRILDSEVKNTLLVKIAISALAIILSIVFLLICVYIIIPSIISNASDSIDKNYARQMYESTLKEPAAADDAEPVFVQPGELKPRSIFAAALAENPDVAGRIRLDGVGIAYLVLQTDDNEYYLKTGYSGKESRLGAVFLDYRCNPALRPLKGHYIIYGHNIESGAIFHNLLKYKDKDTFYDNRIINFDTLYEDYRWEIFSAYTTTTDFYYIDTVFKDGQDWLDFLHEIQQKSMFPTDAALSADDVILTLSTCTNESDSERFVIHARLIK